MAWHEYYGGKWQVVVHGLTGETWKLDGAFPFLEGEKVIRLVKQGEEENIVVSQKDGTERRVLVRTEVFAAPVYYDGKIYWNERIVNMLWPFQMLYRVVTEGHAYGITEKYSYLLAKKVDL